MTASPLPGVLASLGPVLDNYGYLAVAGLVLAEDFGIPVPGETVLIAASVYAGVGRMNIVAVGLIAVAAAVVGDNIGYLIGRTGGRPLALRYGKYVFLTAARLDRAEEFFKRHGGKVVTVARFLEGLRQANGIIAGIVGMHWLKFAAYNLLGAVLWAGLWCTLGDLAGNHIGTIYEQVTRYSLYVLIALGVLVVALGARHLVRHRAARRNAAAPREADRRETEPQDADPRETERQDADQQDADPRDTKPQDADPQDADPRDTKPQDADPQDADQQDADRREAEPQDADQQGAASRESDPDAASDHG